jgi:hypothetical protein
MSFFTKADPRQWCALSEHVLEMYDRERANMATQSWWKEKNLLTTPEDREAMISAAEHHMIVMKNSPITMNTHPSGLKTALISVEVASSNPAPSIRVTLAPR